MKKAFQHVKRGLCKDQALKIQKRFFSHQVKKLAQSFVPLEFANLQQSFNVPTHTIEEEQGKILCNSNVYLATDISTKKIAYIKKSDFFKSREAMGIPQPSTEEATAFVIQEATANALAYNRLGCNQIPKTGIAWTDKKGKPMAVHVSYKVTHQGTLKMFNESAGISTALNPHESILFIAEDGQTYAKLIGDGLHGSEKGKEYIVRVKGRLDLKAMLMALGHSDVDNHHNNIYIKTEYNALEKRWIARPGIFDLGNCFMDAPLAIKYGGIENAALTLAFNPLDDMVSELHLNDFQIAKRWEAKRNALKKMEGNPEFDQAVFDWQESKTPEPFKQKAQHCWEDFQSNIAVIKQALDHLDRFHGVAECLRTKPIPDAIYTLLGHDLIEIKKGTSPSDSMAFLDHKIERKLGIKEGGRVEGEVAKQYEKVLDHLTHTLKWKKIQTVYNIQGKPLDEVPIVRA